MVTESRIWEALAEVMDPEIPVVSLVDLGIIRAVDIDGGHVTVTLTPTFAGCPALHVMRADVEQRLLALGAASVATRLQLTPPWTTDDLSDEARAKLKDFGLAPPGRHGGLIQLILSDHAACPRCNSTDTLVKNTFGPTLCRAIYWCNACQQPFEQFKPL
jgi:ring-1,2-phenylacetyl-CoA epoxidase subunit PaaD